MALKLDIKTLPVYVKYIIAVLPAILIIGLVVFLVVMPKQKEIKVLETRIDQQNNEIAASLVKAEKLDVLKVENERLLKRLAELKEQLPPEKEISSLLKQVSDMSATSGLNVRVWRPGGKKDHPSGIVYEIPVSVSVSAKYHNLGYFLSTLTKLRRIVNVNDMKFSAAAGAGKSKISSGELAVDFTASTFSSLSEEEIKQKALEKAKKGGK